MKAYSKLLADKQEIVAFNKVDAIDEKSLEKKLKAFETKLKIKPFLISAAAAKNTDKLMSKIMTVVTKANVRHQDAVKSVTPTDEWKP